MLCGFEFRGHRYQVEAEALALAGVGGRYWYQRAGANLRAYADENSLAFYYVCDVVSILSPRVSVAHNCRLAHDYFTTGYPDGAMGSRIQALAKYERTGRFNGPKVNAFSDALQGDPNAVVVDAWVYRALGDHRTPGARHYRDTADKVHALADRLGWPPREAQAALWHGVRQCVGFLGDGTLELPLNGRNEPPEPNPIMNPMEPQV